MGEIAYASCAQIGSHMYVGATNSSPPTILEKIKMFFACESIERKKKNKQLPENAFRLRKFLGITILSCVFLVSLVGSGVMWFTDIYVEEIINQLTIREGSEVFEAWRKPPMKPLICIYVFNYTNMPEYIGKIDERIKLEEVGPYCYRETQEKKNITFNDDGTVTYGDLRSHVYEPEASKGSPNDTLIVPNLALIATLGITKDASYVVKFPLALMLRSMRYTSGIMKVTANDLILGYDDKLIKMGTKFSKLINSKLPFDKFGLLTPRSAITDETVTVRTGTNDVDRIGIVTEMDGRPSLDAWDAEECNRIDGSDGAFFPRRSINESATLYLFHRSMCRKMPFIYEQEAEFQDDVTAMRFVPAPDIFNTRGTCFCLNETSCPPDGAFDTSPCHSGAPVFMSFPHFLRGDPILFEPFEGLHPDPVKHTFYMDVQRMLGFTLGIVSRFQMNLQVQKSRGYERFLKEFPDKIILPIAWMEVSSGELPDSFFRIIYHATFTVKRMQVALRWGTLLLAAVTFFYLVRYIRRKPSKKSLASNNELIAAGSPAIQGTSVGTSNDVEILSKL